jgi:hypothetical protein
MHFFKAFSLLATAAFALLAVALPAVDTNAMTVKRQATQQNLIEILTTMNGTITSLRVNIGEWKLTKSERELGWWYSISWKPKIQRTRWVI